MSPREITMSEGLSVKGLWASYGSGDREVVTVKGLTFEVSSGKVLCLLGPSGCGKSTTLRCIAGLHRPSAGVIVIGDEKVFDGRRAIPPERRPIGMVFQSYALWPHKNVIENVMFPLRTRRSRTGKQEARAAASEALDAMGLGGFGSSYPWELSGGQQQRVALARALVAGPELLLLDEPLSNLDTALRGEMRDFIKSKLTALSLTAVFVTHDHEEALALGDEIAVMEHGSIAERGTPDDLYRRPRTTVGAAAVGRANLLQGIVDRVVGDRVTMRTGWGTIECESGDPGRALSPGMGGTVFFRPEDSHIEAATTATSQAGCLTGDLKSAQFLGSAWEYRVVQGDEVVWLRTPEGSTQSQAGDRVVLSIRRARVFPRDEPLARGSEPAPETSGRDHEPTELEEVCQ
jgi:iron(III) transport system ATP-binding protein